MFNYTPQNQLTIFDFKNAAGEEEKVLSGQIVVVKNSDRYKQKIIIVQVSTNLNNSKKPHIGKPTGREKELKKYMRQALINPSFETKNLDLSLNKDALGKITNTRNRFNSIINISGGNIPDGSTDAIQNFLNAELYKKYDKLNKDYRKAYKIYFINELAGDGTNPGFGLYGRSFGIPSTARSVVVFKGDSNNMAFKDSTLAHETFHAMGLQHSFSTKGKNTFTKNLTDNIMNYSDIAPIPIPVIQTWKWEWEILHNNVDKE